MTMQAARAVAGGWAWARPALCGALLCAAAPASAFKLDLGEGYKASFDSTLSYGIILRMQARTCKLVAVDNGGCSALTAELPEASQDAFFLNADDGDLNYNRDHLVSQVIKGTHELQLRSPFGLSLFGRFSELYDLSIDNTERTQLNSGARSVAVHNFQPLDLYVSQEFELLGHSGRLRVGNQVISWGESTFVLGGINWTNAIDVRRAHVPGTQLKEIFRPAPMVSLNVDLAPGLGFEGYWQWHWNSFLLDPTGTYFSSADPVSKGNDGAIFIPTSQLNAGLAANGLARALVSAGLLRYAPAGTVGDPGGTNLTTAQLQDSTYVGPRLINGFSTGNPASTALATTLVKLLLNTGTAIPLVSDAGGRNDGQYGASLHWRPDFVDASFGAYYLSYNEKIPYITYTVSPDYASANPRSAAYRIEYPSNRQLYGVSSSFNVGDWSIGSELSFRPHEAGAIDPSVPSGNVARSAPYACVNGGGEAAGKYCRGWVDQKKWQFQTTGLQILTPTDGLGAFLLPAFGASEGYVLAETGVTYYPGIDVLGGIPWSLPAYSLPSKFSGGYVIETAITYPNLFNSGFNWTPQIDWSHGVAGNSLNAIPWQAGVKAGTLTLNLSRQSRITGQLAYTWYWGGGPKNLSSDRDFATASVAYNF